MGIGRHLKLNSGQIFNIIWMGGSDMADKLVDTIVTSLADSPKIALSYFLTGVIVAVVVAILLLFQFPAQT